MVNLQARIQQSKVSKRQHQSALLLKDHRTDVPVTQHIGAPAMFAEC